MGETSRVARSRPQFTVLGKARGVGASSTFHPELLKPLKGKWDLRMGANLPLRAEKVFGKDEKDWKTGRTIYLEFHRF